MKPRLTSRQQREPQLLELPPPDLHRQPLKKRKRKQKMLIWEASSEVMKTTTEYSDDFE
jgi:hypothetical protein